MMVMIWINTHRLLPKGLQVVAMILLIWLLAFLTEDFLPNIHKATMRMPRSLLSVRERGLHLTRSYVPGTNSAPDFSHLSISTLDQPFFVS